MMHDSNSNVEKIDKCILCSNNTFNLVFYSEDHYSGRIFPLVQCSNCTLIFTNPRPTNENLKDYYPPSYYGDKGKKFNPTLEKIVTLFRKQLAKKITSKHKKTGHILELGAGRGTLLSEMREKGWTAVGTEYSPALTKEIKNSSGLKIYPTPNLKDCEFPENHFDVIVCYHVLEHILNPKITLDEIHRILKPSGYLVLAVPNFGGLISKFSKEDWFGIDVPRHLFHFTPESLKRILYKTGFSIESQNTFSLEQDIFGFTQSVMNRIGFPFNSFYDLIRNPQGRMKFSYDDPQWFKNFSQKSVLLLFGSILSVVGFPITWLVSRFGKGGTIEYWSKPIC